MPRGRATAVLSSVNPLTAIEWIAGFAAAIPDVIEFTMSDRYLNRPMVFPRQATLLKVVFLQEELFTDYDYEVLDEWATAYTRTMDDNGEGTNGIVPDVLERIAICRDEGRNWFRETVFAGGRRGSKGHIGGISGSYVLWHYLAKGDPQGYYGVDRDKQLAAQVFAGKKDQAKANQWRDLTNMILGSNCFTGGLPSMPNYIAKPLGESLEVYAPHDFQRMAERMGKDLDLASFNPSFLIEPKESTVMAARGPASFAQFYDEMAHVVKGVANVEAKEVWDSATPSLDQFGVDAFIWEPSSPWQRMGQFYANYQKALAHEEDGSISYPHVLMIQLASWDIYKDFQRTHDPALRIARPERWYSEPIPYDVLQRAGVLESGLVDQVVDQTVTEIEEWLAENDFQGTTITDEGEVLATRIDPPIEFIPLHTPIQPNPDDSIELQREERANPETFRVERRAHFANVLDAYLDPDVVASIWQPWPDPTGPALVMQHHGILSVAYRAHGDPSKSGANFGYAIAHVVRPQPDPNDRDEKGNVRKPLPHVVFDFIKHWAPGDFPNHRIDYDLIEKEIKGYLDAFMPDQQTFDQYPMGSTLSHLQDHVAQAHYPKTVQVYERSATNDLNWRTYEAFKTASGLGLVHAPFYDQANQELLFLQDLGRKKVDHPTSGPVQTKDVADCMAICVYELVGSEISEFWARSLANVPLGGSQPGGIVTAAQAAQQPEAIQQLAAFGRSGRTAPGAAPRSRRRR